jgi:curved DNA-binding protein CbpA
MSAPGQALAASPSTLSDSQLVAQLEARGGQLGRRDHYAVLGLTPTATRDQVKAAFIALAKIFHPDRLPPTLSHLAQQMSTVFESIREAYEVLYDDAKRAAWDATQKAEPTAELSPSAREVADLMKEGEAAFKKRSYREAEVAFSHAHSIDGQAPSLAAQAWCIYMDPSRKAEAAHAKGLMEHALSLDANCDRAHYQLGVIARVEGDMERAERHFRDAVKVNPRHLEANQEIRLIEMRKKKHENGQKKGFFR